MNETDLVQILSEAFRLYGSMIAQSFNVPPALKPLLNGDAVVTVHLNKDNTITLMSYDITEQETEIKALEKTVKTQKAEVKSLESQIPSEVETAEEYEPDAGSQREIIEKAKPRRRKP